MEVVDVDVSTPSPIDDGPEAQAARRRALEQALVGVRAARRGRKAKPAPEAFVPAQSLEPADDSRLDGDDDRDGDRHDDRDAWPAVSTAVSTLPWVERAACQGADPTLFFGPDLLSADGRRERRAERRRREAEAKAFCADCPVRAQCAAHALSLPEVHGVWGGMGELERLALLPRTVA